VFAAARALARLDEMNCRYERDRLVRQETDNIGVAVDLQGDLFVIGVSAGASAKLEEISSEIKKQYRRLVKGDAEAKKVRPARMTVSNLSACNVESFTAIVNPPESCVLAVGKVAPAVVAVDGEAVVQNRISLTLSVDHRVVSGRYAAEFLGAIVEELEGV